MPVPRSVMSVLVRFVVRTCSTASCATRRHLTGWDGRPTSGLSQQPGEAGGSLTLEAQGRVGAAPTTTGRVGTARRSWARQARREGVRIAGTSGGTPAREKPARNLADRGRAAAHALPAAWEGNSDAG